MIATRRKRMSNDFPLYTTDYISGVMSLRKPQTQSLKILEEITNAVQLRKGMNLKAAVDNGKDTVAREAMSQAQYIAGMGFSNVGLGIVHSMAHPLGAFYDTPHGVANALLLPYVMEYNAESPAAPKYINIAKAMGVNTDGMTEAEGVKAAVEAVKALSLSIGIPQKLHEINVKEEDIPALAVAAFNDVCTGGNPRPTSVAEIEVLYRKAF